MICWACNWRVCEWLREGFVAASAPILARQGSLQYWLRQYQVFSIPDPFQWKTPRNVSQWNRARGVWSASGHVIILGDFSDMLLVLHAMFRSWMGHYIGIPTTLQIGTSICAHAVRTKDYQLAKSINIIIVLRSIPSFTETIRQGHSSESQRPLVCENGSQFSPRFDAKDFLFPIRCGPVEAGVPVARARPTADRPGCDDVTTTQGAMCGRSSLSGVCHTLLPPPADRHWGVGDSASRWLRGNSDSSWWLPGTVSGHGRGSGTGRTERILSYIATT